MKITLLGASFDNDNLGVVALAHGVVTCIAERSPNAGISLLTFAKESTVFPFKVGNKRIAIRTINLRMKPFHTNNAVLLVLLAIAIRMVPVRALRGWLASKNAVLHHIAQSDLVLSIAGGDSFSDIYGFRRLTDVSLPQILALLIQRRLVLLPQTIGPFDGKIAKTLGRSIVRHADLVYSRDLESLRLAEEMTAGQAGQRKARFCYDVGFVMVPQQPTCMDVGGVSLHPLDGSELVGVNVSGLLFAGGYKRDDAFGFRDKYTDETHKILELLIREKNARVLLVPHVLGTGVESDSTVCEALYETLKHQYPGRIGLVRGSYSAPEMKYVIGRCDFFIGARMHACIAALSQGIPAVAFSYSRKFVGVLETLGVGKLVIDPKSMPSEQVLRLVGSCFDDRCEFRKLLEARLPEVRSAVMGLFPEIWAATSPAAMPKSS